MLGVVWVIRKAFGVLKTGPIVSKGSVSEQLWEGNLLGNQLSFDSHVKWSLKWDACFCIYQSSTTV